MTPPETVVDTRVGRLGDGRRMTLPSRPEALVMNPSETAVVAVDMQNACSTEGGYVDLAGFDI